jgi:hypothetical protein
VFVIKMAVFHKVKVKQREKIGQLPHSVAFLFLKRLVFTDKVVQFLFFERFCQPTAIG